MGVPVGAFSGRLTAQQRSMGQRVGRTIAKLGLPCLESMLALRPSHTPYNQVGPQQPESRVCADD